MSKFKVGDRVRHEDYVPFDNECPTGNLREVEVPIVKP